MNELIKNITVDFSIRVENAIMEATKELRTENDLLRNQLKNTMLYLDYVRRFAPELWGAMKDEFEMFPEGEPLLITTGDEDMDGTE